MVNFDDFINHLNTGIIPTLVNAFTNGAIEQLHFKVSYLAVFEYNKAS